MAIFQLDEKLWFPDPWQGEPNGLIAIGGDLSTRRLLLAYANGFFPWYSFHHTHEPEWYCPLRRYVIFPEEIHISHSMRQLLRQDRYNITMNENFSGVIHGCSTAQKRNEDYGAWLGPEIITAYTELHRLGYASSVEVWDDSNGSRQLVGGLYGVAMYGAFFGESMFSLVPNASKLALIHLATMMKKTGGKMIDCQFETPLFHSMGGRHISYDQYISILRQ